jgi:hypothetical protein
VAGPDGSDTTFAGGLVGYVNAATISDAYSLGSVTVTGGAFSSTGGLAGQLQNGSSATNIYATGAVAGSNGGLVAGLAGQVGNAGAANTGGAISNGYWDEGTTGQTVGYNLGGTGTASNIVGIGGNTGLSPYATATYANFDLANTWFMIAGQTRPILRAEYSTSITDAHQLELMTLNLGASYTLANDIDASETASASGVWNLANGFVPVGGNGEGAFTGTLNGRDHFISNLTIIDTTVVPQNVVVVSNGVVGLFGYAGPGSLLENINLFNANVTGIADMRVGALAGADAGSIVNDTSSGTVTAGDGGLIGGPGNVQIPASAGGLVGADNGSIFGSHSSATVIGGNDAYAGGLVGVFFGSDITLSSASGAIGVGSHVDGNGAILPLAGGLIGLLTGGANVTQSWATGAVTGGGGSNIGGFVGSDQTTGLVNLSYATGPVTQTIGGQGGSNDIAGGFAGVAFLGAISQSYSTGAVNSVGGSSGLDTYMGGFVGDAYQVNITNAYSTGAVAETGSTFAVIGGFAGEIEGGANVSFVYATGAVSYPPAAVPDAVGGLAGFVGNPADTGATGGSLSNSYWDEGTTGQTVGYTLAGTGTATTVVGIGGNTGISPFVAATYAGWDFNNIWSTPSAGHYPELYGVSRVLRITAENVSSVYGNFPIYLLNIYGLQHGDSYGAVHGLQLAINGTTTSSSGFYNVGTYALSFFGGSTNESDPYRLIYVGGALTVTPAVLTASLTGTVEKTYDGTTSASLTTGNYLLSGIVLGDIVNLNDPANGTYASPNAGTGILVTAAGLALTGADAGNYLVNASASATIGIIDQKLLVASLIGSVEKTYDGTTNAILTAGNYQLSGVIGGDIVGLNDPASGTYATQNVGTGILVTVNGLVLTGASAGNYTLGSGSASAAIGIIDPKVLVATLIGSVEKTYDGTTSAILTGGNYLLSGVVAGDIVGLNDPANGTYATANAGNGILVTVNGLVLTGAGAGNYTLSNGSASAAIGIIDPKVLVATLIGSVEKTYDGTTSATLSAGNYQLTGVIAGDVVGLNDPAVGAYASPNAGNGIMVTANGLVLTGASAGNYVLGGGSASGAIGIIDPRALVATLVGSVEKSYDGTTNATLTASNYDLTGVIGGDSVSLNDPANGTYASPNAGTGILVTVNGLALTGAQAGDYVVNASASAPIGTIDAPPPPIQTNIVTSSPSAQLSNSDDPGAAADDGSPPAGVVDVGSTTDNGSPAGAGGSEGGVGGAEGGGGSGQGGSTDADASAIAAANAAAAADAAKSDGSGSVFPVAGSGGNDRNGSDNSPVTGGGNKDLWTGSEEGGPDCPAGQNGTPTCPTQGGKP